MTHWPLIVSHDSQVSKEKRIIFTIFSHDSYFSFHTQFKNKVQETRREVVKRILVTNVVYCIIDKQEDLNGQETDSTGNFKYNM